MSVYQLTGEPWVYRIEDQARIHPGHPDYQDYLNWIALGNTPLPPSAEQLAEVRSHMQCKRTQGLRALDQSGYGAQMLAWKSDPTRTFSDLAWFDEPIWARTDPVLLAVAADWGLSPAQIDDLFRLAITL